MRRLALCIIAVTLMYGAAAQHNIHHPGWHMQDRLLFTNSSGRSDIQNVFEATNEFQKVSEGQHVPPGLHVKIDMQTGQRWAKLMDPDTEQDQISEAHDLVIKDDDIVDHKKNEPKIHMQKPEPESARESKLASSDRSRLNDLLLSIKTASPKDQTKASSVNELKENLEDLEEWVHDIDIGLAVGRDHDFISFLLHLSDPRQDLPKDISILATRVLGSSFQNNPPSQDSNVGKLVISTLLARIARDEDQKLVSSFIYVVGSLIRGAEHCRREFDNNNGMDRLRSVFGLTKSLDRKIINLVRDYYSLGTDHLADADENSVDYDADISAWCLEFCSYISRKDTDQYKGSVDVLESLSYLRSTFPKACDIPKDFRAWAKGALKDKKDDESNSLLTKILE